MPKNVVLKNRTDTILGLTNYYLPSEFLKNNELIVNKERAVDRAQWRATREVCIQQCIGKG